MTLTEAAALAASLGGKAPGHLITAKDWNDLVSVLMEYGNALVGLPARVDDLEADLADLSARVDALADLDERVATLEEETAPLRENYLLKVSTAAENFLVGQVAELVFTVSALDGSPLPGPMPWLDVVTTWGRLRAAPGFVVKDNAEENALSIQFNNAGEVRVQLRSHYTKGFSIGEEASFANALNLQAGATGKTVMKVLSESASPQDPETKVAFAAFHATYDSNTTFRNYADKYVGQYTGGKFINPGIVKLGDWEYYRATVMAFAKPDAEATSPDPTRGVATVQVNFREWISHWSDDYVDYLEPVAPNWSQFLNLNLAKPDLVPLWVNELDKQAKTGGALGHVRNLKAMEKAAAGLDPGADTTLAAGKAMVLGAVAMQKAAGGAGTEAAAGFGQQAQVTQQASRQAAAAAATAADAASAKQAVVVLESRVKAAEQTGKEINASLKNIGEGVNKINVAEVADLGGRLNNIHLDLTNLANKVG